jgi:Porin subfamily
LTTTYGMRGAYNHNWDPYWTSSIYGAWAAVSYNGNAKAMICDRFAAGGTFTGAGAGFSCNPDFAIAQIGSRTAWTPVKNLTFSGDLVYTQLDQKHAGLLTIPAIAAIGKPTAVYELKDQGTWTFLARAQRVF